jgi:hypothetical protein
MIEVRKAGDRGGGAHGWLDTRHTFSFADYYDPRFLGYRSLRVLNEDRVAPGAGFPTHPHRDMEILTYVLEGELVHRDSMGNGSTILPGEIQKMSAGTGVTHSEENGSESRPVHLMQIWILPSRPGVPPGYEQKKVRVREESGRLHLIAAPDAEGDAVGLHQDARVYGATLEPGQEVVHALAPSRGAWLQVAAGSVRVGPVVLGAGDGAAVEEEAEITISGDGEGRAEVLLFDLA